MESKMKILWIEDFGGQLSDRHIATELFQGLIPLEVFDDELGRDKKVNEVLPQLLKKNSLHELYHCHSYLEWMALFEEHQTDFDIVFIDINLTTFPTPKEKRPELYRNNEQFDKKAGFFIYYQLIKNKFPEDDIAFFTVEMSSLEDFLKHCQDAMLDLPKNLYEKKSLDFVKVRDWLENKSKDRKLILRRGITEGCQFIKRYIQDIPLESFEEEVIFTKPRHSFWKKKMSKTFVRNQKPILIN